ncbi:hypothetical protein HOC06_02140 [Candidatus Woesearchaeota archaeon]|nr:hypothetical protein [Candidatus Woesearchaeota archaeon]
MDGKTQTSDQHTTANELNTRIRILEGKYNLTRERMLVINQNMLDHYKKVSSDTKILREEITEIKDSINLLKDTMKSIVKELQLLARKEELKVLEKYINMWNPLNFVTKEEVEELIKKRSKNDKSKK